MKILKHFCFFLTISLTFGCSSINKDKTDIPISGEERAKKNIAEGRGATLKDMIGGRRGTNYEFSTSNPMWRATLETLDFLPLTTVDYSGGILITDWYSDNAKDQFLKITIRFLSNEIRSDSLKIIVHEKNCTENENCKVNILESKIKNELASVIIKRAAQLDADSKKK